MQQQTSPRPCKRASRTIAVLAATLALAAVPRAGAQAPPGLLDLYRELDSRLQTYQAELAAELQSQSASAAQPLFGGTTKLATSNRNEALLATYLPLAAGMELDRLQELGVRAIVVDINFPVLYAPYHGNATERQKYLTFYRWLADDIRSRGLKLIVSSWVNIATPRIQTYYKSLGWGQYVYGRMDVARTIARELKPDYLLLGSEPDVEAIITGQPTDNPAYSAGMVRNILANLEAANVRTMPVGAGIGTWQASYQSFVHAYASTSLDIVDFHIYPIGLDFLPRIASIASIARSYGKQVSMSESWLYKIRESELGGQIGNAAFERNVYSFWEPLDSQFVTMIADIAKAEGLVFAAPFYTDHFFGYLDYAAVQGLTTEQRIAAHVTAWITNLSQGTLSRTGQAYKSAIAPK